jgi:acyl carrier protein
VIDKKQKILVELQQIFRNELEDSELILDYESSASNTDGWDSINNLMIISSIEEKFKMSFPIEVIFEAENVGDLIDYIEKKSGI